MEASTHTAWTAARTLDELRRLFRLSDQKLADRLGKGRSYVTDRRIGRKAIDANDMDEFGRALGVPSTVFLMSPADALRFCLDNDLGPQDAPPSGGNPGPDLPGRDSGWNATVMHLPQAV